MKLLVILFLSAGTALALLTMGYIIWDIASENKKRKKDD